MDQYKFQDTHSKMIVDAMIDGYREYIAHRFDRKEKMRISSAFAWTKGNFIESQIAEECEAYGFTYKKSKAGLTWDYLQFIHGESRILFLVKNAAYFNPQSFSQSKLPKAMGMDKVKRTYLHDLSKINSNVEFPSQLALELDEKDTFAPVQLLFVHENQVNEELINFQNSYDEFHIITYELDEAYQISKILHYLPNPEDNIAYLIEDLSDLIAGAELTNEERELLAPEADDDILDPAAYDISIIEEKDNVE